jgi:hypothetical protein
VKANFPAEGRLAKALEDAVVVPMTFCRRRPGSSCRGDFVGERGVGDLKKGEFEGVSRKEGWKELAEVMLCLASVVDYTSCRSCVSTVSSDHMLCFGCCVLYAGK